MLQAETRWRTIIIALTILGLAAASVVYLQPPGPWQAWLGDAETEDGPIWEMAEITTNLRGESRRYIQVVIKLGVEDRTALQQLDRRKVQVRDRTIELLRSRTYQDIDGDDGVKALRQELQVALNGLFEDSDPVERVYVTDLIVQ